MPALLTEQMYYDKSHAAVEFATSQLGVAVPCELELGVLGLKGVKLALNTEDIWGPIQIENVIVRRALATGGPGEIDTVLLELFDALYDATGYARPKNLFHFPAGATSSVKRARPEGGQYNIQQSVQQIRILRSTLSRTSLLSFRLKRSMVVVAAN